MGRRPRAWPLTVAAALLPPAAYTAVVLAKASTSGWPGLSGVSRSGISADALLLCSGVLLVAVPLASVALTRPRRDNAPGEERVRWRHATTRFAIGAAAFLCASAVLAVVSSDLAGRTIETIGLAHVTLASAMVALAAVGAACGVLFRDPLDAAASSTALSLLAGAGILLGGPMVSELPRTFIEWGLTISPVVATAAAAGIDILRTDVLYHVSPIAHLQFDYPVWYAAVGLYCAVAVVCAAGIAGIVRSRTVAERIIPS